MLASPERSLVGVRLEHGRRASGRQPSVDGRQAIFHGDSLNVATVVLPMPDRIRVERARVNFAVHARPQRVTQLLALLEPVPECWVLFVQFEGARPIQPFLDLLAAPVHRSHAQRKLADRPSAAAEACFGHRLGHYAYRAGCGPAAAEASRPSRLQLAAILGVIRAVIPKRGHARGGALASGRRSVGICALPCVGGFVERGAQDIPLAMRSRLRERDRPCVRERDALGSQRREDEPDAREVVGYGVSVPPVASGVETQAGIRLGAAV